MADFDFLLAWSLQSVDPTGCVLIMVGPPGKQAVSIHITTVVPVIPFCTFQSERLLRLPGRSNSGWRIPIKDAD